MAKTTLGRGLGDLLESNRVGAEPTAPVRPPGVGLKILIQGQTAEPELKPTEAANEPQPAPVPVAAAAGARVEKAVAAPKVDENWSSRALAVVALAFADVALLGWTAQYVLSHSGKLDLFGVVAALVTVAIAALCGCAAARLGTRV